MLEYTAEEIQSMPEDILYLESAQLHNRIAQMEKQLKQFKEEIRERNADGLTTVTHGRVQVSFSPNRRFNPNKALSVLKDLGLSTAERNKLTVRTVDKKLLAEAGYGTVIEQSMDNYDSKIAFKVV